MSEPLILIVGAADTGRAPMAVALLRRMLRRQGAPWRVESAGVVGHDDDPAEPEARDALLAMGLDLSAHTARSLSDALVAEARLLVAVESGVGRVVRARYPAAQLVTLGGLAGRARDIPDPFRMQVGAWLQYANEIESLLGAGMPRLLALLGADGAADDVVAAPAPSAAVSRLPPVAPEQAAERVAALERVGRLLSLVAELPDVVDWASGSRQIAADLGAMEQPLAPADLARPYVAMLRATLALLPGRPSAPQATALRGAVARLRAPIAPADLDALAAELAGFDALS